MQAETAKTRLPNFKVDEEAVDHVAAAKAVLYKVRVASANDSDEQHIRELTARLFFEHL